MKGRGVDGWVMGAFVEASVKPGLLALLYKTRWEIEKVFDETKTKLAEKKSWATTTTAKQMQSHFVALVHNLLLLLQDWQREQGVENTAEQERREKRSSTRNMANETRLHPSSPCGTRV